MVGIAGDQLVYLVLGLLAGSYPLSFVAGYLYREWKEGDEKQ